MSHVSAIKTEVRDLGALKAACQDLGLTFLENQTTFKWFGRWVNDYDADDSAYKHGIDPKDYGKCHHAIRVPGSSYEIGLVHNPATNGYKIVYDFYGPGRIIKEKLGAGCEKLVQHYGVNLAEQMAKRKGLMTGRKIQPDGTIKLGITGV